jgi:hypothetical protein
MRILKGKLKINAETLRRLTPTELKEAAGGVSQNASECDTCSCGTCLNKTACPCIPAGA